MSKAQKGFSLIELLIVVAIILIVAAIAVPNFLRSQMAANESSAVSSLRTINTACMTYNTTYGSFPSDLSDLQAPTSGVPNSTASDLLDAILIAAGNVSSPKSGYYFTFTNSGTGYTVLASPFAFNRTGMRYFFTDQSGVIRANVAAAADISSSPIQ